MPTQPKSLGERLAFVRKQAGITQAELAEVAGVTKNTVHRWETGRTFPDADELALVVRKLRVSSDWILFGSVALLDESAVEWIDSQKQLSPEFWEQLQMIALVLSPRVRLASSDELDEAQQTADLRRSALMERERRLNDEAEGPTRQGRG